jgi:hypothetical protein
MIYGGDAKWQLVPDIEFLSEDAEKEKQTIEYAELLYYRVFLG